MSRNTIIVVAVAAVTATVAAGGGAAAVVMLDPGGAHRAGAVARTASPDPTGADAPAEPEPTPTVTVTKPKVVRKTVVVPQPRSGGSFGGADQRFLDAIAGDGIKAPDGWAIEAGNATCGAGYDYAYRYLTDGGLYGYHVQTFLDDWTLTHGGC
ncbi:hypothetical protein [Actinomadura litoris]|uniref:hypothetical protein n=1 Tax=Actinomadura litoris TaxID=2678616 RepID=UPI001FA7D41B|nr:hypothetical protein [Actinomadura litoris]